MGAENFTSTGIRSPDRTARRAVAVPIAVLLPVFRRTAVLVSEINKKALTPAPARSKA